MAINSVIVAGNLTRDVEVRQTASGTNVYNFSVAVTNRKRNQQTGEFEDDPMYIDCVLFDTKGSISWMAPHLKKGFHVTVSGYLNQSRWEDRETGAKRSKHEIIVRDVDAKWPPHDQQQGYQQPQQQQGYQQQGYQQPQQQQQYAYQSYAQPMQQSAQQPVQQPMQQPMPAQQQMPQAMPQPAQQTTMYDESIPFD